jgi:alkylation response protein AidB-like acyl-CoA dehydrogenase
MDFNDTPEEAGFRAEVRRFLEANVKRKRAPRKPRNPDANIAQSLLQAKEWQAKKTDAGFAAITWPKKCGGREGSPIEQVLYNQEEANYAVPRGVFEIGLGMCIPTIMAYGAPKWLERHVRPAPRGEEIWCQLFFRPRSVPISPDCARAPNARGGGWMINGQKIWTS